MFFSFFLFFLFFFFRIQSFLIDNLFLPKKLSVSEERKLKGNLTGCESGNNSGVWRDIGEFLNHQSHGNSVNFISGIAYDGNNGYGEIIEDGDLNLKNRNEEENDDNHNSYNNNNSSSSSGNHSNNDNNNNKEMTENNMEEEEGSDKNTNVTNNNTNNNNTNNNSTNNKNNSNNSTRKRTLEPTDSSINTETTQTINIVKIVAHL